jgi:hypothetical protein
VPQHILASYDNFRHLSIWFNQDSEFQVKMWNTERTSLEVKFLNSYQKIIVIDLVKIVSSVRQAKNTEKNVFWKSGI